ncbi:hypothetical protein BDK51DRAFT_36402 [Blyttiomyces helicus]|uniref:Gelsolin-like domain-containing protein n=1 Tax=Blyttiomyces helicus TaxID=388810 RepID=A0A4P9WBE5_9FUNG|nr:hypothetical protein BDK51DRAFT_36402 [Blyttiomyces helicus]|eukprot:RKO89939.1 hypothetical protein BDK51DRAFT_36402 [Blyttiomyces helicus]
MNKPKPVDFSDSNIAGLGTDLEKKLRLSTAETEKAWDGVGKKVELRVWRIENFAVKAWPKASYGTFFSGDSYIVLNTWQKPGNPKLFHDIHFWLGKDTSQDEAGTAAYKTVELDDYLGTFPVQHREIQGAESSLFLSYFTHFHTQDGGVESGFNHVHPETYTPRLFRVRVTGHSLVITQVAISSQSINSGDVFILDTGRSILQLNGKTSTGMERARAAEFSRKLSDDREGQAQVSVFAEDDADAEPFWTGIGGKNGPIMSGEEAKRLRTPPKFDKTLLRLSDRTGKLLFKQEAKGKILHSQLDSSDVFVVDSGDHGKDSAQLFVWIGKAADAQERRQAMRYALEYIKHNGRPATVPITSVPEGGESELFTQVLDR